MSEESSVPEGAKQDSFTPAIAWPWVDRLIWSERMLAALDNGVKGDVYFAAAGLFTMTEVWQSACQSR